MSEMDQLKKNTEIERAKRIGSELLHQYTMLGENWLESERWERRSSMLFIFAWCTSLITFAFAIVGNEWMRLALDWHQLIVFGTLFRSMYYTIKEQRAWGEFKGFRNALVILGYMTEFEDMSEKQKRRATRKGLFPRFKELFERVGKKEGQESYA